MKLKLAILSHLSPFTYINKEKIKKNFFKKLSNYIFYNPLGNIGHNFMYYGLMNILKKIQIAKNIENFEQHKVFSVIYKNNFLKYLDFFNHDRLYYLKKLLLYFNSKNKFYFKNKTYNFSIACGGPNLALMNIRHPQTWLLLNWFYKYFKQRSIFVDTAIGACIPYKNKVNLKKFEIYKEYVKNSKILIARDILAYKIINSIKQDQSKVYFLPCTSFFSFAATVFNKKRKYILINYMENCGNSTWGKSKIKEKWYKIVKDYTDFYSLKYKIKFFAHNTNDYLICRKKFPDYETIYPKSKNDYLKIANETILAICNRLHCAIPLASALTPCILIGTDSRILSVKLLKMPSYNINDVSLDILIKKSNYIIKNKKFISSNLHKIKKLYEKKYIKIFNNLFKEKNID